MTLLDDVPYSVIGLAAGLVIKFGMGSIAGKIRGPGAEGDQAALERRLGDAVVLIVGAVAAVDLIKIEGIWGGVLVASGGIVTAVLWSRGRRQARARWPVPYGEQEHLLDPPRRSLRFSRRTR